MTAAPHPRDFVLPRLKYVHSDQDRHGNIRYYFKRGSGQKTRLPGGARTEKFMNAYWAAVARHQLALVEKRIASIAENAPGLMKAEEILERSMPISSIFVTGVYFLIHEDEIVYVGQSKSNVISRAYDHKFSKVFNRILTLMCPPEEIDKLEADYIRQLLPKYNIALKPIP